MSIIQTVAIIGQGYVGVPLALSCLRSNLRVIGIDTDKNHIDNLKLGNFNLVPESEVLFLLEEMKAGRYSLSSQADHLIKEAEVIVYCLPTPLDANGLPDLSLLHSALDETGPFISETALVILESTSYPGTARIHFAQYLRDRYSNCKFVDFAFSPERVDPNNKYWTLENTPKLVGALNSKSLDRTVEFYSKFVSDVVPVDSMEIAEMAKIIENSYRLINISFVNELQEICNLLDVSLRKSLEAAKTKPFGFEAFSPGPGIGGHCIPVDPLYLNWAAKSVGKKSLMIEQAIEINKSISSYVFRRFKSLTSDQLGRVLISGVAYKSGVSDTRETPAKSIAEILISFGYQVFWSDKLVQEWEFGEKIEEIDETFLGVIILQDISQDLFDYAVQNKIPILDCSGKYSLDFVNEL